MLYLFSAIGSDGASNRLDWTTEQSGMGLVSMCVCIRECERVCHVYDARRRQRFDWFTLAERLRLRPL